MFYSNLASISCFIAIYAKKITKIRQIQIRMDPNFVFILGWHPIVASSVLQQYSPHCTVQYVQPGLVRRGERVFGCGIEQL